MERTERIAGEMKRVVSEIIRSEVKDPRIPLLTSVTRLKLTRDLKFAKIYVSVYGSEAEKKSARAALVSCAGFIRYRIGQNMTIRALPELSFALDQSIEYGSYMTERIAEIRAQDRKSEEARDDAGGTL